MASKIADENWLLMSSAELPPSSCKGPRLQAFKHRFARIHWGSCLGGTKDGNKQTGSQAYVFKVTIKSHTYALKVFKFFKPSTQRFVLGPIRGKRVGDDELAYHTDPFFAECRAYGRIEQARAREKRVRKVAARCYGFLTLKKQDEERLKREGYDLWPDNLPPGDRYRILAEGSPVRALVKEYIDDDPALDDRTMSWMLKDIQFLNRNKCLNRDIKRDNYRNGLLVDFGCTWTEPHCLIRLSSIEQVETWKKIDRVQFDTMAEEEGYGDVVRAMPNQRYLRKLRPREKYQDTQSGKTSSVSGSMSSALSTGE